MSLRDFLPEIWRRRESNSHPLALLPGEMNGFFDDFFRGFSLDFPYRTAQKFQPSINVRDNENNITVTAELPGLSEDDIEVTLHDDVLEIKGEKKEEHEEKHDNYYARERSYGSFSRRIGISVGVDSEHITTSFDKGVLTLTLPKTVAESKKKLLWGKKKEDKEDKEDKK